MLSVSLSVVAGAFAPALCQEGMANARVEVLLCHVACGLLCTCAAVHVGACGTSLHAAPQTSLRVLSGTLVCCECATQHCTVRPGAKTCQEHFPVLSMADAPS